MKKIFILSLIIAMACVSAATIYWHEFASQSADSEKVVVTGSSTIAPLVSRIAKRYEETHPDVRIDVQTGGSSRGLADARTGSCDVGMISREATENEADLTWVTIAKDAVGLIVNTENTITTLADAEIVAIYTGEVTNWSEVGGADRPITVVNKAAGRATLKVFLDYFKIAPEEIRADIIIGDNQHGIKTVIGNPDAICYVSVGTAEYEVKRGTGIKLLDIGNIESSIAGVMSGAYPLSRPLNLVTRGIPSDTVLAFLEYCQSTAVHDLIREEYFVEVQ